MEVSLLVVFSGKNDSFEGKTRLAGYFSQLKGLILGALHRTYIELNCNLQSFNFKNVIAN